MKALLKEIIEKFEYKGVKCSNHHTNLIEGNWVFLSTFAGDNFVIDAGFEDGQIVNIRIYFAANCKLVPRFLEDTITGMVKMFIKDGFDNWRREHKIK